VKIAFITAPVSDTHCTVALVKAIKEHDPISIVFEWLKVNGAWVLSDWRAAGAVAHVKLASNLMYHVDKFLASGKNLADTPEKLMLALEKAGYEQIVVVAGTQVSTAEVQGTKEQWKPVEFDGVLVSATDEADAKSTIRGRMLKILKDEPERAAAVGAWFAQAQPIAKVSGAALVEFTHQRDYHLGR
jgi:hypothetical protein